MDVWPSRRRATKLRPAQTPVTRLLSRTRILRATALMSAVIRHPSITSARHGFPAKASSTRTVLHVTSVAGTATGSATPMDSSPNNPPYSTDAYSVGHHDEEKEAAALYQEWVARRRLQQQ
ncbi:hypothetical protein C4D60_Mb10t13290 [Musa balbisiana]|uniref:Uncharacterized protein n=1 Tax=Musa balbisiana TaxID=52838 RepID=A0A4S8IZ93_MUSBA|nr:hypothetical protein C4D60_Mb10t13290 [Musa balbisiana]